MIEGPLVSVIIPCFNAALHIKEALCSIMEQTYRNLEIIAIDDGSIDETYATLLALKRNDNRVTVIKNEKNEKLISTLNKGIRLSNGKYIVRMDADDISLPQRIERQVQFMESHPEIGISGTYIEELDHNRAKTVQRLPTKNERIRAYAFVASPFFHPTVIIRKEILTRYNLQYEHRYFRAEDHALWLNIAGQTQYANLPEALLLYRVLPNSETRLADNDREHRRMVLSSIHKLALSKINISLSPQKQFIYSCSMVKMDIPALKDTPVEDLLSVYDLVIDGAKLGSFVNSKYLKEYLSVRFIAFLIYSGHLTKVTSIFKAISSSYFYSGCLAIIKKQFIR